MRVLVVHPGPAYSVADVYNGWIKGLRAQGVEVVEYDLSSRLWVWQNAHLKRDGEFLPLMPFEQAIQCAAEPLGTWLYECWPDVVVFVSAFWNKPDTFDLIRTRHRTVLLCTESPYEEDAQIERAAHFDVTLLNDPTNIESYSGVCDHVAYVPHSYDPEVHTPGPVDPEKRSDLCMVGTGYQSRIEFLERMALDGLDVALLGNWKQLAGHRLITHVRQDELDSCIDNAETVEWYRSTRASLNLYRREATRPELSAGWAMGPREVELAACGTFFLTEERGENAAVLPMVPKVCDAEDAGEQLRWWLAHDRERERVVADARAAVAGWTFENRAAELLRLVDKIPARTGR